MRLGTDLGSQGWSWLVNCLKLDANSATPFFNQEYLSSGQLGDAGIYDSNVEESTQA